MKRKIVLSFIFLAFLASVSAQLKVDNVGDTYVNKNIKLKSASGFLGTTGNFPITFKVNGTLAGFTGYCDPQSPYYENTNVAFGIRSLNSLTATAGYNTATGAEALYSNTSGSNNTASGYIALRYNMTGSSNTAIGAMALRNTSASGNTAIGCHAMFNNVSGSYNTAIGYNADVNSSSTLTNATAIGYGAVVQASNTVQIGNTTVTSVSLSNFLTLSSDGRAKKNIQTNVPGLAFIKHLQPVTYNLDLDILDELQKSDDPAINARRDSLLMARSPEEKAIEAKARANKEKQVQTGFIAQDVEKIAKSIGYDFIGVDAPENDKGAYGLRYAAFVVPLVKAVQELSEQNDAKDAAIASLQEQINELKGSNFLRSAANETETTGISDPVVAQCKLYQNAPNPFNLNTEIKFYISENVKVAQLCIYNLQGTQIKQIMITQRGESLQLISGSELTAGMYLYALIVDGKEVDVKRMILTK